MTARFLQSLYGELSFQITQENLRIRSDQIRARLRLYPVLMLSQALLEPLFLLLFWNHASHYNLLGWLACMFTLHTIDMLLWWRYRMQVYTPQDCKQWSYRFNFSTAATAAMWGAIALWFFPPDLAYQALMICLILGLVAGAVTLNSVYPPSLYIYVLGVTLPMIFRLLLANDDKHLILAIMLILFVISSLSAGRELSKTFWKSLWQRYENDQLILQLTEQKAIAVTASHDKSRFLASASHDLRQPLQALVLFSDALQSLAKDPDTQHLARQVSKSVGALVDMFDELLDISKLDAGVVLAVKQHFKLQEIFERLNIEFKPLAHAKGLTLIIPQTDLLCYSDPTLLERILRNLISNAIRYTDTGYVTLGCPLIDDKLHFDVTDSGIGICAESIPHIFEEYYQVDNQHRDRLKGLGLGLSIVRRMEALIDCKVNVISEPNIGSVFSFCLPAGALINLHQPQQIHQTKHDLNGITVALIDDNREIRSIAATLIKQWGCHVYDGELPHDVLQKIFNDGVCPDILVCDHRLPHGITSLDAIQLSQKLWQQLIPTLVLTGDTAAKTLQQIKNSGALLLHKPISPARLRSIMYFALHNKDSALTTESTARKLILSVKAAPENGMM